jgi:hypothetical protein
VILTKGEEENDEESMPTAVPDCAAIIFSNFTFEGNLCIQWL